MVEKRKQWAAPATVGPPQWEYEAHFEVSRQAVQHAEALLVSVAIRFSLLACVTTIRRHHHSDRCA
jgi:hypothetical protein